VSDAELVARARAGDTVAFGELVDRHRAAVYRATLAALGSHADAEDAAQDAFVAAYRRLADFREEASFKTWLLSIAWRQALNRRRGLVRWWRRAPAAFAEREGPDQQEDADALVSACRSPEDAASGRQLRRAIAEEIRALTPKLRDALLLAQSGDYNYQEIGAMLGAPVGTVKWRVSEARKTIKRRLNERGFSDVG
jgi:RNA polymerase sigma-70 factor (ECF subfamily)